jgi:hypothetical protein
MQTKGGTLMNLHPRTQSDYCKQNFIAITVVAEGKEIISLIYSATQVAFGSAGCHCAVHCASNLCLPREKKILFNLVSQGQIVLNQINRN